MPLILELVFSAMFQVLDLNFSRIALWRKRLQLDSKNDLTTNGLISGFFVGNWLLSPTSYLYGLKSARIAQFLFFFWRHPIFSMFSLRGILVCSSKMLVHFSHMIFWYRLISFRKAMQLYPLSLFVFEPFFSEVVVMSLITSENQIVCFPSCVLNVFWCYTSYTVLIVFERC